MRKDFKPRQTICRNMEGNLINDEKEILNCWRTYFMELLDGKACEDLGRAEEDNEDNILRNDESFLPSREEISEAIKKLKNNRSNIWKKWDSKNGTND